MKILMCGVRLTKQLSSKWNRDDDAVIHIKWQERKQHDINLFTDTRERTVLHSTIIK
jgi:hypothetical protein